MALALAGTLSLGLLAGCQKDTAQENTKGSQTEDKEEEKAPAKDSIVIGTSVTANFRASWFDEAFSCKTAKFTFPGGNFGEFIKALDMAYEDHEIQRVFWGLDTNLLTAFPQESTELLPDYLYNDNPWDDVEYLYNKDVLFRQIVSMLYAFRWDPVPTVDDLLPGKTGMNGAPRR